MFSFFPLKQALPMVQRCWRETTSSNILFFFIKLSSKRIIVKHEDKLPVCFHSEDSFPRTATSWVYTLLFLKSKHGPHIWTAPSFTLLRVRMYTQESVFRSFLQGLSWHRPTMKNRIWMVILDLIQLVTDNGPVNRKQLQMSASKCQAYKKEISSAHVWTIHVSLNRHMNVLLE